MNSVVHFEVPFDNKERANKFYQDVFGWQMIDIPEMNYTIARTGETDEQNMLVNKGMINGGMTSRVKDEGPVIVIDVPSIDEHITKIEAAGGSVVAPKMDIGDMGYYARVTDSEGNVIGIWENKNK